MIDPDLEDIPSSSISSRGDDTYISFREVSFSEGGSQKILVENGSDLDDLDDDLYLSSPSSSSISEFDADTFIQRLKDMQAKVEAVRDEGWRSMRTEQLLGKMFKLREPFVTSKVKIEC